MNTSVIDEPSRSLSQSLLFWPKEPLGTSNAPTVYSNVTRVKNRKRTVTSVNIMHWATEVTNEKIIAADSPVVSIVQVEARRHVQRERDTFLPQDSSPPSPLLLKYIYRRAVLQNKINGRVVGSSSLPCARCGKTPELSCHGDHTHVYLPRNMC